MKTNRLLWAAFIVTFAYSTGLTGYLIGTQHIVIPLAPMMGADNE